MNVDFNIIENNYKQEFSFISKLYLKETFPHSWIFYGPKDSGKRRFLDIFIKKVLKEKKIINLFMKSMVMKILL